MLIGYARTSTSEQNMELQIDALKECGCEHIYTDVISGATTEREGLKDLMKHLRNGDTFVVWKLDRLGRSVKHLIEFVKDLETRGVQFKSLQDSIDTSTPGGKLVFHIFCSLAEFERDLLIQRTHAGLAAARARGRFGGRREKLNKNQIARMKEIYEDKKINLCDIAKMFGISKQSVYNYMRRQVV